MVRHLVFVPDLKTNCSIFSCLFCNLTDVFFHYLKSAESKNFLLNLLHLCLSVNLSDDLFSPFSPLTIYLRHIPELEKEPKLWSTILDGFYFDLSSAFSSKNSWLLPCGQNDHTRFRRMKISCLSIVMSCSHDVNISFSCSMCCVTINILSIFYKKESYYILWKKW